MPVRLRKDGKPDGRSVSSKIGIKKAIAKKNELLAAGKRALGEIPTSESESSEPEPDESSSESESENEPEPEPEPESESDDDGSLYDKKGRKIEIERLVMPKKKPKKEKKETIQVPDPRIAELEAKLAAMQPKPVARKMTRLELINEANKSLFS